MKNLNKRGVTLPGSDDPTPIEFGEKMKALFESYVKSELIEEDLKNLKSSDRLQFIEKMTPYFIRRKDGDSIKKKIIIGRRRTEEEILDSVKMLPGGIIPDDWFEEEWRGKTWEQYYALVMYGIKI